MNFFTRLWRKIRNIGCRWPKTLIVTVRDGDCQMLAQTFISINGWDEAFPACEEFCQEVMCYADNENLDEVYWTYEVYE